MGVYRGVRARLLVGWCRWCPECCASDTTVGYGCQHYHRSLCGGRHRRVGELHGCLHRLHAHRCGAVSRYPDRPARRRSAYFSGHGDCADLAFLWLARQAGGLTAMKMLTARIQALGVPSWAWSLAVVVILTVLGLALEEFPKLLLGEMLIAGLFAMSLNLILGYGGMVHFGHAAFYGIGGYTLAILSQKYNVPIIAAMIAAPILSAALAVIIGWFCVRRVRLYFAILTLAFGQLIYILIFQARDFTGGDDGLQGLLRPEFLLDPNNFYLFTLLVFVVCFFALRTPINAPFLLTFPSLRENPERAGFI